MDGVHDFVENEEADQVNDVIRRKLTKEYLDLMAPFIKNDVVILFDEHAGA